MHRSVPGVKEALPVLVLNVIIVFITVILIIFMITNWM